MCVYVQNIIPVWCWLKAFNVNNKHKLEHYHAYTYRKPKKYKNKRQNNKWCTYGTKRTEKNWMCSGNTWNKQEPTQEHIDSDEQRQPRKNVKKLIWWWSCHKVETMLHADSASQQIHRNDNVFNWKVLPPLGTINELLSCVKLNYVKVPTRIPLLCTLAYNFV